ncbi:MerR family DNA-binding transcriptional regulator [Streptomyces sp. MS19]|uniref:helix-turn-helix domain-containing protein n=1 Tax=Streptomyces sp. MS19 TaxID=3385972 RepID=UPI0039A33F7F
MNGDPLLTIGGPARRTGLSVRTVRFWSDEGLVPPTGRSPAGYRLYDAAALGSVRRILPVSRRPAWGHLPGLRAWGNLAALPNRANTARYELRSGALRCTGIWGLPQPPGWGSREPRQDPPDRPWPASPSSAPCATSAWTSRRPGASSPAS